MDTTATDAPPKRVADDPTASKRAADDPAAPKRVADDTTPAVCGATLRSGRPCSRKSKGVHPEDGALCGVHLRVAERRVECSICMCEVRPRQLKRLECGHEFHRRCVGKWFRRGSLTCPMCRAVCFAELSSSHPLLSARMRHLLRVVPPPPGIYATTYLLAMLNSEPVVRALGLTPDQQQLLIEVAYQSFSEHHFLEYLRLLGC